MYKDELVQAHAPEEQDEDNRAQNGAFKVVAVVESIAEKEVSEEEVMPN